MLSEAKAQGVRVLRKLLRLSLAILLVVAGWVLGTEFYKALSFPTQLRLLPGESYALRLGPLLRAESAEGWIDRGEEGLVSVRAADYGRGDLEISLFGIPVRRTEVDVVPRLHLIPGGESVGVVMGDGVTVTQVASVRTAGGETRSPAGEAGVRSGDIIRKVGDQPISHGTQLEWAAQEYGRQGIPMPLVVQREGELITLHVHPALTSASPGTAAKYVIGVWVRENAAGVGTLTFWDPVTYRYGALGHQIAHGVTESTVPGGSIGRLVQASIQGITPGQRGKPGEKAGVFSETQNPLGTIDKNTPYGIYGRLDAAIATDRTPLPVALAHEVELGPATILTVVDGERVEEFEITITHVNRQSTPNDKGLQLRVTDPRLLAVTNGIVQGMSGSPIIQNNRIVGAVTHVFVNDPHRGYGILAEWMAYEAGLDVHQEVPQPPLPRAS